MYLLRCSSNRYVMNHIFILAKSKDLRLPSNTKILKLFFNLLGSTYSQSTSDTSITAFFFFLAMLQTFFARKKC